MRLTFELRSDRTDRQGRHPIRLRVEHQGKQQRLGTGLAVHPKDWDHVRQRVKVSHPASHALNDRLRALLIETETALIRGEVPRANVQQGAQKGTPMAVRWRAMVETRYSNPYSLGAARSPVRCLEQYAPAVLPAEVTREWLLKYAAWMKAQGYRPNTVADRLKRTRQAVEVMRAEDGLPPLPSLRRLGVKGEDTGHKLLAFAEVQALLAVPPRGKWERLALDLWAASFYLGGMRFGDLIHMRRSWIRAGWLEYRHSKTGKVRRIPLLPEALAVLDRYPGPNLWNPLLPGGETNVRWQGNVLVNRALKALAQRAGLNVPLSMHWARHSFAEWAMVRGVHPVIMQQILGHSKFSTTEIYLQKFNTDAVGEAFGAMFGPSAKEPPQ